MNRRFLLSSALALLVVTVAACGSGPSGTPGVTDDLIRIGMPADLTGPIAFLGQEFSAGAKLYFQYANETGGIHGRKLELIVEDDGYQPPRTVAAYRKLIDRDEVFCITLSAGTAPSLALKPIVEREQVPIVPAASWASAIYNPPSRYVFGVDPTYRMQSWIFVEYIADELKAQDAKIGVIFQDDDLGADGLLGLREAAEHYGIPIVAEAGHKRGAIDFGSQVLNVREAGATHVVLWTALRESAAILKEADGLGWSPEFFGWFVVADDRIVEFTGDASRNLHVLNFIDMESDSVQMTTYRELVGKNDPGRRITPYHAAGYGYAQLLAEGLRRAGIDLTREKLVEALETLEGWDDNLIGQPFTYSSGRRGGSASKTFFMKVDLEKGKLVRVTQSKVFEMPEL